MAECKGVQRDMVCVDTYRVLDSCRDKDCFEDVRVFLTVPGVEMLNRAGAVRAKTARVVWACVDMDSVPFNRGFYQLLIRIFCRIGLEVSLGQGNTQECEGVAVVEKKVVLFGGEGNVSVFKSELSGSGFCHLGGKQTVSGNTLPLAVFEVADPIVLETRILDGPGPCCCSFDEIPDRVSSSLSAPLTDCPSCLAVSLGFFSVVRIERPAQYLVNAVEYSVPEKQCEIPPVEDACSLFRQMAFPTAEFSSSGIPGPAPRSESNSGCCGDRA